jgi:hypothetical protein
MGNLYVQLITSASLRLWLGQIGIVPRDRFQIAQYDYLPPQLELSFLKNYQPLSILSIVHLSVAGIGGNALTNTGGRTTLSGDAVFAGLYSRG